MPKAFSNRPKRFQKKKNVFKKKLDFFFEVKDEVNDDENEENKPKKRNYTSRQKVDRSKSEDLDCFYIGFFWL